MIFQHGGYLTNQHHAERPLPGVAEFFRRIPWGDYIILVTSRTKDYRKKTLVSLRRARIRFDLLLTDLPIGERILINDIKPTGLKTAHALNLERNEGLSGVTFRYEARKT